MPGDLLPIAHPLNWKLGWSLILLGLLTGAALGLRFHRDEFLGGYASLRRRLVRLGHIALVALGGLNVLYGFSPLPAPSDEWPARAASLALGVGGVSMPAVCFLSAYHARWRALFFIPVAALVAGVALVLLGGWSL